MISCVVSFRQLFVASTSKRGQRTTTAEKPSYLSFLSFKILDSASSRPRNDTSSKMSDSEAGKSDVLSLDAVHIHNVGDISMEPMPETTPGK
jgi:hypothetical protein